MRGRNDPPHAIWLRLCALGRVVVLMSGLPWRLTKLIVVLSLIGFLNERECRRGRLVPGLL